MTQEANWEERVERLKSLTESYAGILEVPPRKSIQQIRQEVRELQNTRRTLMEALDTQQSQIEQEKFAHEKRTTLLSTLRTMGLELYQLDQHRDSCPLCGTEGITETVLRKYLEKESVQGGQRLENLQQAVFDTENEIQNTNSLLKKLGQQEIVAQEYHDALNMVKQMFPKIQNAADLRQEYTDAQQQLRIAQIQTTQVKKSLLVELGKSNITGTIKDVCESRQKLLNEISSRHLFEGEEVSDQRLVDEVTNTQKKAEEERKLYSERLSQYQDDLKKQTLKLNSLEDTLAQKQEQMERVQLGALRLERISAFWKTAGPAVADTALSGEAVLSMCQQIRDLASGILMSMQDEKEKGLVRKKLMILQGSWSGVINYKIHWNVCNRLKFMQKPLLHRT